MVWLLLFYLSSELDLTSWVFSNIEEKIQQSKKEMEEWYSTNKPLMFRGVKYDYWKEQIIAHFESIHIDLWDMVENGNHIPYDDELNEIPRS